MRGSRILAALALAAAPGLGLESSASAEVRVEAARSMALSPGRSSEAPAIGRRCPTFHWGPAAGASSHELVVFELASGAKVLERQLPGTASSWTPNLRDCPERGLGYGWSIRARTAAGLEKWADPLFFRIPARPTPAEVEAVLASRGPRTDSPQTAPVGGAEQAATGSRQGPAEGASSTTVEVTGGVDPPTVAAAVGITDSPDGAGLVAVGADGGADLILRSPSGTDALVSQEWIDRPSADAETFNIQNSGAGDLLLLVDAALVHTGLVSSADIQDGTLSGLWVDEGTLVNADLADSSFSGTPFSSGIVGAQLTVNTLGADDLAGDSVASDEIENDSILGAHIAAGIFFTGSHTADRGLDVEDLAVGLADVTSQSVTLADGSCVTHTVGLQQGSSAVGDLTLVVPDNDMPLGLWIVGADVSSVNSARVRICNFSGALVGPVVFDYFVLVLDTT